MRYLITGGAGFIGSHLVDALTMRGEDVLVPDDLSTGRLENLDGLDHELAGGGELDSVDRSAENGGRSQRRRTASSASYIAARRPGAR